MAKAKTAQEFDRRFDEGEDIFDLADIDEESIRRPGLESQRINLDLPRHFLEKLDQEADVRGITRQSLIKSWLFDRLKLEGAEPEEEPKPFVSHLGGRRRAATAQPSGEMGEEIIKGVVERAWPNDYQGTRYYFANVNGLQLQTTDPELGEELLHSTGQEIEAKAEPLPRPGKFFLKILKSFEYLGQATAREDARCPEDDAKPATARGVAGQAEAQGGTHGGGN
jgi:hypothetical protein